MINLRRNLKLRAGSAFPVNMCAFRITSQLQPNHVGNCCSHFSIAHILHASPGRTLMHPPSQFLRASLNDRMLDSEHVGQSRSQRHGCKVRSLWLGCSCDSLCVTGLCIQRMRGRHMLAGLLIAGTDWCCCKTADEIWMFQQTMQRGWIRPRITLLNWPKFDRPASHAFVDVEFVLHLARRGGAEQSWRLSIINYFPHCAADVFFGTWTLRCSQYWYVLSCLKLEFAAPGVTQGAASALAGSTVALDRGSPRTQCRPIIPVLMKANPVPLSLVWNAGAHCI